MAEHNDNIVPSAIPDTIGTNPMVPVLPTRPKRRRKRSLKLDKEQIVSMVLKEHQTAMNQREERINLRINRYIKLRGWLPGKDGPWENAANFWLPIMLIYSLRTKATLENATKSVRPMMNSKSLHRRDQMKQDKVDKLLDYQFFVENEGEKTLDQYISNYVDDEAVFTFTHWVNKQDDYRDIRVLPGLDDELPVMAQTALTLPVLFPSMDVDQGTRMLDEEGWKWELEFTDEQQQRRLARVEFFERDDNKLEAYLSYRTTVYDAPSIQVVDFEDIVFPVRSANLQPTGADNPYGAPWVNMICKASVDEIKRGKDTGWYDLLTKDDLKAITEGRSPVGSGKQEEKPKESKDALEGTQTPAPAANQDTNRQIIRHYGRWDVNNDGFEEDVIFWVETNQKKLMKAVYLTEMYPGLPVRRPINSESFIPVPNRIYGVSLPELLESLQDISQMLMNQHIDWGTITNVPFFFYRAASGMKPEVIKLNPGDGYPLDDPSRDVNFPTFATRSESYTLNTMGVLQQFAERLAMISDIQFGRVPTGKASAFRTAGATLSILAQGDVRSEQVLRRLFHGIASIYQTIHRLNQRYLPEKKEVTVAGASEQGQEIYQDITPEDINGVFQFEFKASLLNTNKQLLSTNITEMAAMVISPLAVQAGLVTEQEIYTLMRDKAKAMDLDPDKYVVRPPNFGPKLTAEEAIGAIIEGKALVGTTLEPPEEHLGKLQVFMQSEQFGLLDPANVPLFKAWAERVTRLVQQRQALAAAAGAQPQEGEAEGPGGVLSSSNSEETNAAPKVQPNQPVGGGELQ